MAQFTLEWDNENVLNNDNAVGQRASYRSRTTGGSFITAAFNPANDLPKSATTTDSPVLLDNVVYQFKVEALCTINGPTINDNDIQEVINFVCIDPVITHTYNSGTISLDVTGLDITKAKFTLRKSSDNTIVGTPSIVAKSGTTISKTQTGLLASTNYYWQVELYAIIDTLEVVSSNEEYLGAACSPYPFTTEAPPVCDPITAGTISSIEVL